MSDLQTVQTALDKINAAIVAEREANDERLKQIEKGGVAHPETLAKIGNIEADIAKLRTGLDESLKAMARLSVGGAGTDDKDAIKLKGNARLWLAAKNGGRAPQESEIDVGRYQAYCNAFPHYIRAGGQLGETLPAGIRAELSVGSESDGGFLAPTEMSSRIIRRLFETSDMRSIATVMSITADAVEFPVDHDEAASGGFVTEKATRTETGTPKVGIQKIEVHEQYAEPHATQKILDDAAIDVEAWLAGKISDIMTRTENARFVTGTGAGAPRGFLDYGSAAVTTDDASRAWGVLQYVATGTSAGFGTDATVTTADDPDCLITIISKLKPAYRRNARWTMNRGTEATVRKLKDANGRYFVGMGDIKDGVVSFPLFGFPIHTMEDMPAIASDTFSIAFGDFRAGYTIVDRQGIRVLRDPFTSKPFVKFYTTKRVGGDVTDFDAIKLLKFGTS